MDWGVFKVVAFLNFAGLAMNDMKPVYILSKWYAVKER